MSREVHPEMVFLLPLISFMMTAINLIHYGWGVFSYFGMALTGFFVVFGVIVLRLDKNIFSEEREEQSRLTAS